MKCFSKVIKKNALNYVTTKTLPSHRQFFSLIITNPNLRKHTCGDLQWAEGHDCARGKKFNSNESSIAFVSSIQLVWHVQEMAIRHKCLD